MIAALLTLCILIGGYGIRYESWLAVGLADLILVICAIAEERVKSRVKKLEQALKERKEK